MEPIFDFFLRTTCTCRKGKKVRLCLVDSCHRAGRKVDFQVLRTFISESGLSAQRVDWGNLVALPLQGGKPVNWTIASLSKKSRSRKKFPAGVNCCCKSQKKGKKVASKRFRRKVKVLMHQESYEQLPFLSIELTSPWNLGGDGNSFYGFSHRV